MKLLFNNDTFSDKFKEKLGFPDADISFTRLKPFIIIATDDILEIIGEANYNQFFDADGQVSSTEENKELLALIEYAILLRAYIQYAPTGDLAVTNNGRLIRKDELHVSAFQHQIEANDEALEQHYYRHLDKLLKYFFKKDIALNSKRYDFKNLFVPSLETFEEVFDVGNSHYLYIKLLPALHRCEEDEILPRIGETIFEDKINWALLPTHKKLLASIQKTCVYYALAWGIPRLNIQIFPKGLIQKIPYQEPQKSARSKSSNAIDDARLELQQLMERDWQKYALDVEKEIKKLYPVTETDDDIDLSQFLGFGAGDNFVDS